MPTLRLSGGTMVFLGAFCWSLCSPIVKFLNMDSFLVLGLRSVLAALALSPFLRPKRLKWNGWMVMYLLSYAGLTMAVLLGLSMTSAPIVIGMQYTSLVLLFLLNWLRTRKFDKRGFLPVFIIMAGVVVFMCSDTDGSSMLGNLVALSEGAFFAGLTISAKKAAGSNSIGLTAISNFFTFLLVLLIFPDRMAGVAELQGFQWGLMLVQGVIQVGGGYTLYNMGLERVTPQKASIIALWEMVMGPLWVALFLGEFPSAAEVIGLVIIMAGIFLDAKLSEADSNRKKTIATTD